MLKIKKLFKCEKDLEKILKLSHLAKIELKDYRYYSDIINNELYIFEWHIYYEDKLIYTTKKENYGR